MRHCTVCGKGSRMGGARKLLRGHYNPVNWSRKYPNLQLTKIDGKRALVCTACLRTIAKPTQATRQTAKAAEKVTAKAVAVASK